LDLHGRVLHDITLVGANLYGTDLRGANLRGAKFDGADLTGATFTGTSLDGVSLKNATLTGVKLVRIHFTNRTPESLRNAKLLLHSCTGCDLSDLDSSDVRLVGANLDNTDARNANMSDTSLVGASFRNARLEGASLRNAAVCFPQTWHSHIGDASGSRKRPASIFPGRSSWAPIYAEHAIARTIMKAAAR
jgi:uncharacterized protein YjbI with pentapeptide repeats